MQALTEHHAISATGCPLPPKITELCGWVPGEAVVACGVTHIGVAVHGPGVVHLCNVRVLQVMAGEMEFESTTY